MSSADGPTTRRRGDRAGIDRAAIVDAARGMDADQITMSALAVKLGVDRKAINHHVPDRGQLLELVAADAVAEAFISRQASDLDRWQDGCYAFAQAIMDAMIATGSLALYFRMIGEPATLDLDGTESLLQKLVDAGFSVDMAVRSLSSLATIALGYGRDLVMIGHGAAHPQTDELNNYLDHHDPRELPLWRSHSATSPEDFWSTQFDFAVRTLIAGLEATLTSSGSARE